MDCEQDDSSNLPRASGDDESRSAVNSLILDYYKKFGRKRDLEQYFSLSTAQSDVRDPSSLFWARMKAENESSDSGERSDKKSDSSQELCRISIRFPAQDLISQEEDSKTKTESTSPPIIIEELPRDSKHNSDDETTKSDDEAVKSDDNSQKSYDVHLDTSLNKLYSPSSSITSQRKLEWDSLADVGYANESDRKTSASSLSTLERLALKQQYSNNDTQQNSNLGVPTAHSTPLDENDSKLNGKKGVGKKSTKIYKKDVDVVEVNVPQSSNMNPAQSINVNLTKHISFNVEKDGKVTVDNVVKDISVSPEKVAIETEASPVCQRMDREMQTSLPKASHISDIDNAQRKIPILISLNTLRSRVRRRRIRMAKHKIKIKKQADKENIPVQEKSGEQLSEAESFEYMPGHIYNQNQMTANNRQANPAPSNAADNKSSLESSGVTTSDSSKGSKHSFSKDLEKSIDLLKSALKQRCDDSTLRKQLIQQVCQRLLNSRYRDDESTTDFLSGLSFSSKKLGLGERNNTTTSTSDANNSTEKSKRPKKSILRTDKFNPGSIASTSQSVPNLPIASKSENLVASNLTKNLTTSNTESDMSSKEKTSSDNGLKTTSDELYKKYLQALKREEAYKKHLKDKEKFLKQKLVSSDGAIVKPLKVESKPSNRLKDLIHDLTRNNYNDGSGDASKLEGGPGSHRDFDRLLPNSSQRSHSVFTLASGISDGPSKKPNMKKKHHSDVKDLSKPGPSKDGHYCCCPHHENLKFTDSSVQVNIKNPCTDKICPVKHLEQQELEPPKRSAKIISDDVTGNIKYVCLCRQNVIQAPDDFLIYKCSRLNSKGIQLEESLSKSSNEVYIQCSDETCTKRNIGFVPSTLNCLNNKSSQTNMLIKMLEPTSSLTCGVDQKHIQLKGKIDDMTPFSTTLINEATRCIQTEISINPKISEPTLSDINIVSDTNCAKLISEHCREMPKSSVTDLFSNRAVASTSAFSDSCKSGTSKDMGKKFDNREGLEKNRKENVIIQEPNTGQSENIAIPIHGTNMTLMVSIGSECTALPNRIIKETVTESTETDKVEAIEQATSLSEECSKGVQSDKFSDPTELIIRHNNRVGDIFVKNNKNGHSVQTPLTVNTCVATEEPRFGTYPQTSPVCERKPFRRANTDTDQIQCALSTRNMRTGNGHTQTKCGVRSNESSEYDPIQQNVCPCGCKGKKENCQLDCNERTLTQNKKLSLEKGISTQDTTEEKCRCGCGGSIDACKKECHEKKSSLTPRGQSLKQPSCGHKLTTENILDEQSDKCSCGCGGNKNTCKKSCNELSSKKQCGTQATEQISTEMKDSLKYDDKCSCGCDGDKNICKMSCNERKSLPTVKNPGVQSDETQPVDIQTNIGLPHTKYSKECGDKEFYTQTDTPLSQPEKCSCGCGGTKDKCKKSCKDCNSSPRNENLQNRELNKTHRDTQTDSGLTEMGQCGEPAYKTNMSLNEFCPCGCGGAKDKCKRSCKESSSSPRNGITGNKIPFSKSVKQIGTQRDESPTRTSHCSSQSLDKEINTQTDNFLTKYQKCPCGCGGEKNKCKKSCLELQLRSRSKDVGHKKQCGTQSNKQIDTQTYNSPNEIEKCPCGCGGTKENCQKDCIELNEDSKEQFMLDARKQDQSVYAVSYAPNLDDEKCPCGCGGMKNQCLKNCKGAKPKPKEYKTLKEIGTQKNRDECPESFKRCPREEEPNPCTSRNANTKITEYTEHFNLSKVIEGGGDKSIARSSDNSRKPSSETTPTDSDPILTLIQNITKKYTKNEVEKNKKKKCFKEIMTVLNYLLDTEDSPDSKDVLRNRCESTTTTDETDSVKKVSEKSSSEKVSTKLIDKGVQPSPKKSKSNPCTTDSSEVVTSTDIPGTSTDSGACKVLNKIKKECEKYHKKRCKIHEKNCEGTSSTSANCEQCKRVHHCQCRSHKCKYHKKMAEKTQKSPVAYNLILQTSESVMSEGPSTCEKRTLKNIIVKVPKKKPHFCMPFRELAAKFEKQMSCGTPKEPRCCRSKSLPNDSDISSMEEIMKQSQGATVREYLEKNRPDFIEKCGQRQTCMRYISESRANERAAKRELLSLHLAQLPDVTELNSTELTELAAELGRYLRKKQPAPKFISEREMKKHSEKIYKSLPEVVQRKEEQRKETIKKTNLLMANMFKRNLQKKTLRGSVNLSNYSTVIKI